MTSRATNDEDARSWRMQTKTRPTLLERAFELARTGRYATTDRMTQQLRREGYDPNQITGRVLLRQLRQAIADARLPPPQSRTNVLR
jgi:hypothetical protein